MTGLDAVSFGLTMLAIGLGGIATAVVVLAVSVEVGRRRRERTAAHITRTQRGQ